MIRIAFITPIFPIPLDSGIRVRIFHLARHLGRRHDVRILSLDRGETELASAMLGIPVETLPAETGPGMRNRLGPYVVPRATREQLWEFIARCSADILHVEMDYGAAMLGLPDQPMLEIPVVLDSACTYHLTYRREANWAESLGSRARAFVRWLRLRRYEARLAAGVDAVLAVSKEEAEIVRRLAPETPVPIVPNGVDCETFRPLPLGKDILFCGTFTWGPNRDAAMFFLRRILPHLRAEGCDAEVLLVGGGVDEELSRLAEADGRVLLPGRVPEMIPWYARAGVVINPMRGGGGTRLKVLEALATGRPVVSTRIGAEGLEVSANKEVYLADDPMDFSRAIVQLLRDREQAEFMGQAGRCLAERLYDWKQCLEPLDTLYEGLLHAKRAR